MCLYRRFSFVLVAVILASAGPAIAIAQPPRLQIDGPKDNKITITVRNVPEPIVPEPIVSVGGITAKNVPGSLKRNPDKSLFFEAELPADIKPGKTTFGVEIGGEIIRPEPLFDIPDPLVEAGKQPIITNVSPKGGLQRDTIKITGKNFGDKVDQVWVILGDINFPVEPVALSRPDSNGLQELVFTIPDKEADNGILDGRSLYHYADLTVHVHGRGANGEHLTVVHPKGLWKLAGLSLALCLTFLAPLLALLHMQLAITAVGLLGGVLVYALMPDLFWIIPAILAIVALMCIAWAQKHYESWRPVGRTLFLDKVSNTYSLSKCQAFAWTVVLMGSYLYFALGRGLFLGTEAIPDFKASLLGLLTISYGGLVLARGINSKSPKNDLAPEPPRLSNLITEGGIISITRLQLVGFTMTAIVIYLYYVCGSDLFANGLPDIPPTLNGLLAISQGGYLGGKIVGDMVVNYVLPRRVRAGEEKTLKIFGAGFVDRTKVLIQDDPEPHEIKFISSTSVEVPMSKAMCDPGLKQLVFIPPTGSGFLLDGAFELVDPKMTNPQRLEANRIIVTIEGINLTEGELWETTFDGRRVGLIRVVGQAGNQFTLEARTDFTAGAQLTVTTRDGITFPAITIP